MKRLWVFLFALIMVFSMTITTHATVVTFDDLTPNGVMEIPAGYQGFNWNSQFFALDEGLYKGFYRNSYSFPTSPNVAYNGYGVQSVSLDRNGSLFNFNGAYFSTWATENKSDDSSSGRVTVTGFNGVNVVGSVSTDLPSDRFTFLEANFKGIDRLEFRNDGREGKWWVMDNIAYDRDPVPTNAVPIPAAAWLLGSGLLGLVGIRRKAQVN
jgi:hypothetical protein